jgi:predicted phage terminase large subunit-like protein
MELEKQKLTNDFSFFIQEAWSVIEPKTVLYWSWHYDYICEWLDYVSSGAFKTENPEKEGLIINVPPRTAKSTFVTICWPVWTWLKHPERRFLCGSYSGKLAVDHHNKRRDLLHSRWFRDRFQDRFSIVVDKADDFRNDKTGYFIATSVGGSGTGFGGDICIGDDLLSATDAMSKATRESTNSWIDNTFSTRLNSRVTGCFVHVSQRLADDDPTGYLLSKYEDRFAHIMVEREATGERKYIFPVSKRTYNRPQGDILQPQRCPPEVLAGLKRKSREWAGQEQQQPAPEGGAIIQTDWWRFYKLNESLPSFDLVVISVDCAFKAGAENDFVSIQKWGAVGPRYYLLERKTEHMGYVATKTNIKAMALHDESCIYCRGRRPDAVLIEDAANGPAVIEELRKTSIGRWPDGSPIYVPIVALTPFGGKESRLWAAQPEWEAGNVYACEDMPGWPQYLHVMSHYAGEGSVPHDDDVDATSQFIIWRSRRILGLANYFEARQKALESKASPTVVDGGEVTATNPSGKKVVWNPSMQRWLDYETRQPV